jgi:hypothetical protein
MAKASFNKKMALFTNKMDLELMKKLVKRYVWSIALYGRSNTWKILKYGAGEGWRRSVELIM